jgi:hypothetical protein
MDEEIPFSIILPVAASLYLYGTIVTLLTAAGQSATQHQSRRLRSGFYAPRRRNPVILPLRTDTDPVVPEGSIFRRNANDIFL